MTQLVLASTLYGAATVAAAIDAGAVGDDPHRVLVVANTTGTPEIAPHVHELAGFDVIAGHFAAVHDYNWAIAPQHPSMWRPRNDELPIIERHFRDLWGLGSGPVELVVESIQVPPARTLAAMFAASRLSIYADGLMTYGPTRSNIGAAIADRVRVIVHPDLVPGLRPALLREYGVPSRAFDPAHLRSVLDSMAKVADLDGMPDHDAQDPPVLVLGQYLSALGILTADEERDLHQRMIAAAHDAAPGPVWYKAHPSAPPASADELVAWGRAQGIDVHPTPKLAPAEAIYLTAPPRFVVGCFSTALYTAVRMYDIAAATVGADVMLEALTPYENSNRVPVTIIAATLPDLESSTAEPAMPLLDAGHVATRVQPLVDTVAYCMQPSLLAAEAPGAAAWLADHAHGPCMRYFKRRRLTSLGLPGGVPIPVWRRAAAPMRAKAMRAAREARRVIHRVRAAVRDARRF